VALFAAALVTSCGESPAERPTPATPKPASVNPVDPATAGTIKGKVTFTGRAPAPVQLGTKSDPQCIAPVHTEDIVTGDGDALQNVFVYVKDGLGALVFPVPATSVVLAQEGCTYRPHVFGIQVGQTLDIVYGDETLHNVHATPSRNGEFNLAQTSKGSRNTRVFRTHEVLVPFKCDVHKWMKAYVGVVEHPFFAVTGRDGSFALQGLPPGTYTIEAVHEKLGTQMHSVTLAATGSLAIAFSFEI
jgi:plastocyanin